MGGFIEVPDVDNPHQNANAGNDLSEHITEVIQLLLERSRSRDLRRDALVDITNGRVTSSQNDNGGSVSGDNGGAGEQHVDLILLDGILVLDGIRTLADTLAFTGEDGLVDAEAVALNREQSAVGWDAVAHRNGNNIAGNEVVGLDALDETVANHLGLVRRVFLEGGDGLLGTAFLGDADDGIEDQDGQDLGDVVSTRAR